MRHAQSAGQAPDADLTVLGHQQAQNLIPILTVLKIDALFTSPYLRASATIAPYAGATDLGITTLPDLHERVLAKHSLTDWQTHIAQSFDDFNYSCPGGESMKTTCDRAIKALTIIANSNATFPAAVSHGNLIAATLNRIDRSFGFEKWQSMGNPELFKLTLVAGLPSSFEIL
ncbi:MAG: histidine phosphatase family protein [Paracoccaceae bacterium]